jgi:uncharacterized repeat protein (TIGR03899 family)
MEFNDVLGLGKVLPLDKLIDVISKGVGRLTKSYFDKIDSNNKAYELKKLADARVYELNTIAKSIKDATNFISGISYLDGRVSITHANERLEPAYISIEQRGNDRLSYQEAFKQLNIETITSNAASELNNEPPVTDEPVDEDWINRFFSYAKDISNEDMQILWGKILAGEVKNPNSFSIRTLDIIRNLSKEDANIFIRIANFAIDGGTMHFIYRGDAIMTNFELHEKYDVKYHDILTLREAGIVQDGDHINLEIGYEHESNETKFSIGDYRIYIIKQINEHETSLPVYGFTRSGRELLKLITPSPSIEYLNDFGTALKKPFNNPVYYSAASSEKGTSTETRMSFPIKKP